MFQNRLFVYLSKELDRKIDQIVPLRENVFLIHAGCSRFVLKGFRDLRKLKVQEAFTFSLHHSGFRKTYRFYPIGKILYFRGMYYGCIEFIEPDIISFHYSCETDRLEGVNLLDNFHAISKRLAPAYDSLLPKADTVGKWKERKEEFVANKETIQRFAGKKIFAEYERWGDSALAGLMNNERKIDEKETTVLHGDVAHHNFLRATTGELYLIDFDLISIGSPFHDLLQYANRILPFISWKLESLEELGTFVHWLENDAFLYGLLYPSDVFREWNRALRGNRNLDEHTITRLVELTVGQFQQRKQFIENVKSFVE